MIPSRVAVPAFLIAVCLAFSARAQDEVSTRQIAIEAMYPVMIQALESGNFGQARNICDQIITWEPLNPVHHYNLACIEAKAGGARLPLAFDALAEAVLLGFNDVVLFQSDPDLSALRSTPRFQELLEFAKRNASGGSVPAPPAAAATPAGEPTEMPPPATFQDGAPVGLYLTTRSPSPAGAIAKVAWYFAPDGWVYRGVETGLSAPDLEVHPARGRVSVANETLTVTWTDGPKSSHRLSRAERGFTWNGRSFEPVRPFDNQMPLAGIYEGRETAAGDTAGAGVLELRLDGTFTWLGVSFVAPEDGAARLSVAGDARSTGRWRARGFSLALTDANGVVYRRLALPDDDAGTPQRPDRILLGGSMYQKR